MERKPFSLKAKIGVYVLLFLFLIFPIAPNLTLAADDVPTDNTSGATVAQAETGAGEAGAGGAGAGEAAGGVAATGASSGLSAGTIAAIALGAAAVAVGIAAVAGSDNSGEGAAAPTVHH